jgi:prepilin-type N-terminal cleavage/methylation domain-containing protein
MKAMHSKLRQRAFTIVELLTVVVVVAVLLAVAAPSLHDLLVRQRLKSATAELVTDLRYIRTIALSRRLPVNVMFKKNATMSCYILYVQTTIGNCDCLTRNPGQVCVPSMAIGGSEEFRTTQIPASTDIQLATVPAGAGDLIFTPDGLRNVATDYVLLLSRVSGGTGQAQVTVNATGRPTVCSPDNSVTGLPQC